MHNNHLCRAKSWLLCLIFRTLVTLHLLQSHCTRGPQYPKQGDRRLTGLRLLAGFSTGYQLPALICKVRLKNCVQWTYCVNPMQTRTVPDVSTRYLPKWVIYFHSNFDAQGAHIRSKQQDSTTFNCQVHIASQDRIYT